MATTSRIVELANTISTNTKHIDEIFAVEGLPTPSFDADSPPRALLDSRVIASREAILEATDELHALMQGPIGILTTQPYNYWISLQAIYRFGIATSFPADQQEATFTEIAKATDLSEARVRRILRHAMAFRIFDEPRKGIVRHTAASKALADDPLLRQWVGMVSEELWPAATKTVDALTKWPESEEASQTGYQIAYNTDATIFQEVAQHPDREARYADAMSFGSNRAGLEHHHILDGFNWSAIGNGTVVDVGGSHGSLCIAIAERFPKVRCIVQDKPEIVDLGRKSLPPDLSERVSFMGHDFFTEQPIRDADVYILRHILHDWSDKYATRVLRGLVPALNERARVLVLEHVLPEPGTVSKYQEKGLRSFDYTMWATHNAKERDLDDWKSLFQQADPKFEIDDVTQPPGSRLSIIESRYRS